MLAGDPGIDKWVVYPLYLSSEPVGHEIRIDREHHYHRRLRRPPVGDYKTPERLLRNAVLQGPLGYYETPALRITCGRSVPGCIHAPLEHIPGHRIRTVLSYTSSFLYEIEEIFHDD